jgi:hypothetical protein
MVQQCSGQRRQGRREFECNGLVYRTFPVNCILFSGVRSAGPLAVAILIVPARTSSPMANA